MCDPANEAQRFSELLLLVARATESDPRCGATKLNKILFYADFGAYRALGRSISGQAYRKLEFGPAPRSVTQAVDALVAQGVCAWADRTYFGYPLRKLVALREPSLALFTAEEVELVHRVVEDLWELNATEVSDLSHRFAGWQAAAMGEEISYNTVFVGEPQPPLTEAEAEWALEALQEYREQAGAA